MLPVPRHSRTALLLAGAVLALGACGSSGDTTQATTQAAPAKPAKGRYSVSQVAKLAGFKAAADGHSWTSITGCRVTVIMTTHAEVLTYRPNPDALVVTNPADDIGVKFDPTPGCRDALTANLTKVR